MRIVITGSAGRVGSSLVTELLEEGHDVVGLDRIDGGQTHARLRNVVCEFTDAEAVGNAVRGAEVILHLGAFMSWAPADANRLWQSNVEGTRTVLEAATRGQSPRFVFASSGEVYPEVMPQELPITESHPRNPRSVYGLTKHFGEELVWFYARTRGIDTTVLRFSHTQDARELLDPDSFFSGARFFLRGRIRQQRLFGNDAVVALLSKIDDGTEKLLLSRNERGEAFRMGISDTRDIAKGVKLAMLHPGAVGETFNLCPDAVVEFDEAIARMAAITSLDVVTVDFPGPGVRYETSNRHIKDKLGYQPSWDFGAMLSEAADAWHARAAQP